MAPRKSDIAGLESIKWSLKHNRLPNVCFVDCIGTHQEPGASPCEEKSGLGSQKEASENRLREDRAGRETGD